MKVLFSLLYFLGISKVVAWIFNRLDLPVSTVEVLFLFVLLLILIISVGLAEFTVGKIRDYYRKN